MVAQDVMTKDVISVAPDSTAEQCAQLMEQHHIKRLPVVIDGRLVGVVSRPDLLGAILELPARIDTNQTAYAVIRTKLHSRLRNQAWHAPSTSPAKCGTAS